jgi:RND family efflux transporter MFP subunit
VRRNNAQSDWVAAKSRVVAARQQLQRTSVRAPFDGLVSERKVSVGDTVQVGRELLKVIDPGSMRFEGLVSADHMQALKVGQPVHFRINGFAQGDFAGRLQRIDSAANATTRQVAVQVNFVDPARVPRVAGLFAEGRIETGSSQALMLQEGELVRAGEAVSVWRVNGSALAKVAVKLGERDARSGEYPVLDGLAAGERILRKPTAALVEGQKFELAPAMARAGTAAASAGAAAPAAR